MHGQGGGWRMLQVLAWFAGCVFSKGLASTVETKGPVFIYEPPNQVDFSNMTGARIECTAHGVPPPSVQWLRADGTPVVEIPSLQRVLANGTLVFRPFRAEDYRQDIHAVVYKCVASNPIGTIVSRDVKVRGVVKQFYEVQVYDEFVIKGNIAVLKCHVPSFVRDHVLVAAWMKDDTIITHSSTGRITISSTGELYIRDAGARDSLKNYRCKTVHRLTGDVRQSSAGRLIITDPQSSVPPRLTHSVTSVQVRQGDVAELPCTAQGYPVPTYKWYKLQGKQPVPLDSIQRISQQHNLLIIQNVDLRDTGTYICVINNTVGEEKVETTLLVSASLSAYIQPQQQVVDADKSTELSCVISGHPVTSVSWSKNGRPIEIDGPFLFPRRDILQITSIRREDRGMYQCFVENDEESVQATAELRLGDASPVFLSVFQEQIIQPGTPTSLQCIVSGNPTPEISWTLDGSSIPVNRRFQIGAFVTTAGDVISHVNISIARVEDGGDYTCTAKNILGQVSHAARLNVMGIPYIRQMANQTIVAGTDFHIRCPASGYPIHSITWEREGSLLPAALHQLVFPNGTLMVKKVQRTDAGSYTCIARNDKGQTARKTLLISVLDPPTIEPFSFPRDVREGMRARVLCSVVEGDSPVTILWTRGDEPLPTDLGATVQTTDEFSSLLVFRKVAAKHNGNYTCIVSNAAAVVQHTAELLVHVPPHWVNEPNDIALLLGHRVELPCQATGYPQTNITWMKGEGRLPGDYKDVRHFGGHIIVHENGSLIIEKVKKRDDGYYLCQATNGIGSGLSKVVYVTVNVPAYFEIKHRNQTARKGDEIRVQCEAWGDSPLRVRWNRNDRRIEYEEEHRFITTTHQRENSILSELIIKSATKADSALFTCFATNAFGHDEATVQLFIEEKPAAPTNVHVTEFTSRIVSLAWTISTDGNSKILQHIIQTKRASDEWNHKTTTNVTIEGGSPKGTVHHLLPGMSYTLRVLAENRLGRSTPSESVEIATAEEVPSGPPLAVETKATSSESLKVIWKPPRMELWNGEILGYYTGYKVYDSSEPYRYKTVEAHSKLDTIELYLTNLRKFTKYSVLVQAFNRVGKGPHSDEVVAITSEDAPSEPPQEVQCVTHTSQSLHVSWSPPPLNSQNGIIRGYKIFYRPNFDVEDDVEFHVTTTTALKTNLHNLDKYTNYSIRVLAYTRMGDGVRSEPVHCRTLEDVPGAPAEIKSLTMSSDSILVAWRPPINKNGNIIKYTLYIRGNDNGKQHTTKHFLSSAPHLSHEARGLTENHNYEFWVTASTVIGEGESTRVVTQAPKSKVMARIATFSERIVTKWKQDITLPCRAVGLPTPSRKWKVEDRLLTQSDRFITIEDGALLIKEVLSEDSSNYTCEVENIYGRDQITYQLIVQAPPTSPNLTVMQSTDSSIRLKVNAATTPGNKIKGYTLSYKREFSEWEEIEIEPHEDTILLDNLHCGSKYLLYLTAYNKVGAGHPSGILTASTAGGAPMAPKMEDVLVPNSTWLALNLQHWPNGGCQILYFVIDYKPANKLEWVLVSNNIQPHQQNVVIPDLEPGTVYQMRVTAHNDAGSTVAEFETRTLTLEGEMAADAASHDLPFYDWRTIFTVVVSALAGTAVVLCAVFFFIRKRRYRGYRHSYPVTERKVIPDQQPNTKPALENGTNIVEMTYNPSARKYSLPSTRTLTRTEYNTIARDGYPENVNPYATFNVPGCQALIQDVQMPATRQSRIDESERNYNQQHHPPNKNPFELYSRVIKRLDNSNEEADHRNAPTTKYYPPLEGNPSLAKSTGQTEFYKENTKYDHPYQTWEGRRHHSEYDSVLSDTDNSDLGGSYFSESTVQLHGRGRVPDLIYHTTDSSTSNESSPDEDRRPARSKKPEYLRNNVSNSQVSRDSVYPPESRPDQHVSQLQETTFTLQPKQPYSYNYPGRDIYPDSTQLMNLHNHRRPDEPPADHHNEKFHQTKNSDRDCAEDYTIRV